MRQPKYKNNKAQYYYQQKQGNYNAINYEKNLNQAQKLYYPNYNYNYNELYKNKFNNNRNNLYNSASKSNKNFKQILNNYMNDYEKLKRQNKIPKIPENYFSYQEYESKKSKIKEIFNNFMDLNKDDEFRDINKLIDNLPDDDEMLLKNKELEEDYYLRLKIDVKKDNQDSNKLNQNVL